MFELSHINILTVLTLMIALGGCLAAVTKYCSQVSRTLGDVTATLREVTATLKNLHAEMVEASRQRDLMQQEITLRLQALEGKIEGRRR